MLSPLRKLSWQCNHRMTDCAQHTIISSIFRKSVSSHWQIAVDSSRKRLFDSSGTAFGLPPSPQPRYMYHLRAMMELEPRIGSQGSTYFLALWFTIVKNPYLAILLAYSAMAYTLSKTRVSLALSSQRKQRLSV